MERVLTLTDPRLGGSKEQGSSPRSSSLSETEKTPVCDNEEESNLSRSGISQVVVVQDHYVRASESAFEGEEHAGQLEHVYGCHGLITHERYLPKLAAKKSFQCAAGLLDDVDQEQECRSASEAALALSRKLAGAESLQKTEVMMIMEKLYRDHPGAVWRRTSREAIKAVEAEGGEPGSAKVLIYGEISFIAFSKLLEMYAPKAMASVSPTSSFGGKDSQPASPSSRFTFYDLGCGAGRPVFLASLLMTSCFKSCGVEIIPTMHQMNEELLQLYNVEVRTRLHPAKQSQNITFMCGDMLQVDWSDADVVFINATCFSDNFFANLEWCRLGQIIFLKREQL
ncbi:hypothetical protein KC19_VG231300 [Ceratodon purpureus]|uniref:Histone-lysine N-methyltransferase, H3 lysine-79 specific n=1 Tax=Ceratodon purpureus TaxID=3225 RepID=A0A8T0HTD6_CERPU|nr:hypothetical protein KC19_VG231300 [Ceratodon purpureus]